MQAAGETRALGIDVGGSGIKGAVVDLSTGQFLTERFKVITPVKSTPEAVATEITRIVDHFEWDGPVGVTLPSVVKDQVALTAANIDSAWIGTNVGQLFSHHLPGQAVSVLNDADAAGLAEVQFGHPKTREGSVIFLTFGTGIGSAFLLNGALFPNTELGHLSVGGQEAEHQASSALKDRLDLGYPAWAKRVNVVMQEYEALFHPTTFIVGGGISRKHEKWVPLLQLRTPVLAAELRNRAGIVGAAMAVAEHVVP